MSRWSVLLLFLALPLVVSAAVRVQVLDPAYDEFEGLDLAEALIRDGRWSEASPLLDNAAPAEALRTTRLRGDWHFAAGRPAAALEAWGQALAMTELAPAQASLHRRRARAFANLEKWTDCAAEFARAGESSQEADVLLQAHCLEKAARPGEAWRILVRHEGSEALENERLGFLLRRGLRQVAFERAQSRLATSSKQRQILVAELFEAQGASSESFKLLEIARVAHPGDADVLLSWAQLAHRRGLARAVAEAYEQLAWSRPKYFYHAAELWRQVGRFERSSMMNLFIVDETERLKQTIALAVDRGRYDRILSLTGALSRSPLAKDDDVNYALSYAFARVGDRENALRGLERVTRADLLPKAAALRESLKN